MDLGQLREAALDRTPVSLGSRRTQSPHEFYRYPARFSPGFAAAAISHFSKPGDVVLDPFVGGGTTVVEGVRLGRRVIASDLNPLATFITRVKTTTLDPRSSQLVRKWLALIPSQLNIHYLEPPLERWRGGRYLKDLESPTTWRVRKLIAQALHLMPSREPAQSFCRCVVLRTAQWALDMRGTVPSAEEFRSGLTENGHAMLQVQSDFFSGSTLRHEPLVLDIGLPGLSDRLQESRMSPPAMVLTSPPYPGVYVNYHRWKLRGRREISAPYWIANCQDGNGLAYYTMSGRVEKAERRTLNSYFIRLEAAFADLAKVLRSDTPVVQLVGFSDAATQLERYLEAMEEAGFAEEKLEALATDDDGRLWRDVPGRRWWTEAQARKTVAPHTSREVVLIHRRARKAMPLRV